jgi:hypothetical protein
MTKTLTTKTINITGGGADLGEHASSSSGDDASSEVPGEAYESPAASIIDGKEKNDDASSVSDGDRDIDGDSGKDSDKDSSDRDQRSSACSSDMGTEDLIANGCMYTILEQMLMTTKPEEGRSSVKQPNVADILLRIAVALEGIQGVLSSRGGSVA